MEDGRVFRGEPLAGFAGGGGVLHSDLYWLVVSIIFMFTAGSPILTYIFLKGVETTN